MFAVAGWNSGERSLKGFTRPVNRIVQHLREEYLFVREAPSPIEPLYSEPQHPTGPRLRDPRRARPAVPQLARQRTIPANAPSEVRGGPCLESRCGGHCRGAAVLNQGTVNRARPPPAPDAFRVKAGVEDDPCSG